jgi:hypothetical protein
MEALAAEANVSLTSMPGTVYILGAGASRAATDSHAIRAPLAVDFFRPALIQEHWYTKYQLTDFGTSALARVLEQYFGLDRENWKEHLDFSVNVEEVYSFLETFRTVFAARTFRPDFIEQARLELLDYVLNLCNSLGAYEESSASFRAIASRLRHVDSVVTFNWDMLFDVALQRTAVGRRKLALLRASAEPVQLQTERDPFAIEPFPGIGGYYKLHGSVNFTVCTNNACVRRDSPYVWGWTELLPDMIACQSCGAPTRVALLPPHGHKSYAGARFFSLQAQQAASRLHLAEEVVVIGYSFPAFDLQARALVRSARDGAEPFNGPAFSLLKKVVLVDPRVGDSSLVSTARDLFGIDHPAAHGHQVAFQTYDSLDSFVRTRRSKRRPAKKK